MEWYYWVWSKANIPKHSFISWLAAQDRLKTRHIMQLAGLCSDTSCFLCIHGDDSGEHIFFKSFFYGGKVCHGIVQWLGMRYNQRESLYTMWKKWGRRYKTKSSKWYVMLALLLLCIIFGRQETNLTGVLLFLGRRF